MSRQTESTRAAQRPGHPAGEAQPIDFDAEHRPDVAHRASMAGLRRHAAAIQQPKHAESASHAEHGVADATLDQRRAQAVVANETGAEAIATALRLGAKDLLSSARQIDEVLATPPGAAGMDRQLRAVEQIFERAHGTVDRLGMELGLAQEGRVPEGDELKRALSVFERAHVAFDVSVIKAKNYAHQDPQQELKVDSKAIRDRIKYMFDARKWTVQGVAASVEHPGEMDHRLVDLQKDSTDHLVFQALEANAAATTQSAHLLRMRMASASDEILAGTLPRIIAHLSELASLLERVSTRGLRAHTAILHKVVQEVRGLEDEAAGKPALAGRMGPGTAFYMALRKVRAKVDRS